jgi:IS4 transposase
LLHLPALKSCSFYDRLFSPLVTLWLLLFQRLNADHSLDAALTHARTGGADSLKPKLSGRLRSASTASYSGARKRLPWPFLLEVLQLLGSKISGLNPGALWKGWPLVLLDGSTVRLRSYGNIPKQFPPHRNQHSRASYWCLMRVVAGFCAFSGAALDCALGSTHLSEQVLGCQMILRAAVGCLFIGDRNFGIFLIAQAARAKGHQVLLRLTDVRAAKLLGRALSLGDHPLSWKATRHTQRQAGLSAQPIPGRLLVVRLQRPGFRSLQLCLFTSLLDRAQYPLQELVKLYGLRWQVELNLRYIKAQMQSAQLETHSAEMARKEWLASLIAYNLVRAAMLCSALHTGIQPLALSFCSCRRRLECWLEDFGASKRQAYASWHQALTQMSQYRLPKRRKARPNEPRAQRHLWQSFPPLRGSRAAARKKLQKSKTKS